MDRLDLLAIVQKLHTIAQAGLTYSQNPFDRHRYEQLHQLAAEIVASSTGGDLAVSMQRAHEALALESGYPTPKIDVRAVVPRDGKLLFVREVQDGLWALPGGWADIGESPAEMAVREVREETGLIVGADKLLALYDKAKHEHPREFWYCYKAFFRCSILGGELATSFETLDVGFFGEDELPPLSMPRVTLKQVQRMFEHVKMPDLPTDFD